MNRKFILNFVPTGMIPPSWWRPCACYNFGDCRTSAWSGGAWRQYGSSACPWSWNRRTTYKKEYYAEIIRRVRVDFPDIIICVTTSGETFQSLRSDRMCLVLRRSETGLWQPDLKLTQLQPAGQHKHPADDPVSRQKNVGSRNKAWDGGFDLGMIN